ncbi:helix-turn-helix domain-containing protein [Chryseobacterium limigenitum]|uniref:Tetratricopeptide repeat-containing protein n=1 Tax=Chryseobacterium limigenitum TaxID=1612149 RepID=A0A1K2IUI2_9FLAO|nr:helix-turn-helix domain-containing protein [Chryseobacterium limigenitum]SFZ95966.1 Tetratricopeptide repeat-containing protein [Chryseobacterium limigenitum]
MTRIFQLLLFLFFAVNCSGPKKQEKYTQESVQKEIDKLEDLQYTDNPTAIMNMTKEIKKKAKAINFDLGVFNCNLLIMSNLHSLGKYKEMISLGKENDVLISTVKNSYDLAQYYTSMGTAYSNLGLVDEGRSYLNKALEYNNKVPKSNEKYLQLATIYGILAFDVAMRNKSLLPGPTKKYYLKELWALKQVDDSDKFKSKKNRILSFLYLNLGIISNQQNRADEAENYFHKSLDVCKKFGITKETPLIVHNEMSWLLYDQKRYDSCIVYAYKGLIFEKNNSKATVRRDLYEVLYKSYSEKGDAENSSKYTKLYMKLNDSILDAQEVAINEPVKNLIEKKEDDHKDNLTIILVIIGGVAAALAILIFFLWRRNQKVLHSRYEKIITELKYKDKKILVFEQNTDLKTIEFERKSYIHDNTINQLLLKLDKFEKSERFLKKDMNLSYLASSFDTNPNYLSTIINQHKGKNFNNYLNGLRIHYLVKVLYKEPIFRQYKISYLSEYCGFASRDVFGIAFKKETGMTPSYFIDQLKIDLQNDVEKTC